MVAITHPTPLRPLLPLPDRPVTAATYRRRRLVAGLLVVLVLVVVVLTASRLVGGGATPVDRSRPIAEVSVLVQPGDTVWSIAESLAGTGDVRPIVDAIVAANGGADLAVGERLLLSVP
jgi:hypothetical protein